MKLNITEDYLDDIVQAMASSSKENIHTYFEALKLLPDGEEIAEALQAKMLRDFYELSFPEQKWSPVVLTTMLAKQIEEQEKLREASTERTVSSFSFYSDPTSELEEEDEEDETEYCEDCDCEEGFEFAYEVPAGWFRNLENHAALTAQIKDQKKVSDLSKLIQSATTPQPEEREELVGLKSLINAQLNKPSLAELIAGQLPEEEEAASEAPEATLLVLCDQTIALLNGKKTSPELSYDFAQELDNLLDTIVAEIINSNIIDDVFSVGDYSVSLYEYVFSSIYNDLLMEKGIIENPDFAYKTEYSAYLMTELSRHFVEQKGYALAFVVEDGIVAPVLKANN